MANLYTILPIVCVKSITQITNPEKGTKILKKPSQLQKSTYTWLFRVSNRRESI